MKHRKYYPLCRCCRSRSSSSSGHGLCDTPDCFFCGPCEATDVPPHAVNGRWRITATPNVGLGNGECHNCAANRAVNVHYCTSYYPECLWTSDPVNAACDPNVLLAFMYYGNGPSGNGWYIIYGPDQIIYFLSVDDARFNGCCVANTFDIVAGQDADQVLCTNYPLQLTAVPDVFHNCCLNQCQLGCPPCPDGMSLVWLIDPLLAPLSDAACEQCVADSSQTLVLFKQYSGLVSVRGVELICPIESVQATPCAVNCSPAPCTQETTTGGNINNIAIMGYANPGGPVPFESAGMYLFYGADRIGYYLTTAAFDCCRENTFELLPGQSANMIQCGSYPASITVVPVEDCCEHHGSGSSSSSSSGSALETPSCLDCPDQKVPLIWNVTGTGVDDSVGCGCSDGSGTQVTRQVTGDFPAIDDACVWLGSGGNVACGANWALMGPSAFGGTKFVINLFSFYWSIEAADWNCFGPNTLTYDAVLSGGPCAAMGATVTVVPG